MALSSRAAAIRGDDYQHAIGWYWACEMLGDQDIVSVSVEEADGGYFDDILVRRTQGLDHYIQAKSSNYGKTIVDREWLLASATERGKSPLQRMYATYLALKEADKAFSLELWTNRGFDNNNPFLGELLDQKSDGIRTDLVIAAKPKSLIGKESEAWAVHLEVEVLELTTFLDTVRWKQAGSELDRRQQARKLMELAGLRIDDEAVQIGIGIVREWVTDGTGPRSRADVQQEVVKKGLLARDGTLLLAINGIDRDPTPSLPNSKLDFVDLYEGDDSFSRKLLKDAKNWNGEIWPEISRAASFLAGFGVRRVHIHGAMRLPMWFAVGHALPEVKKWSLSVDQVNGEWRTNSERTSVVPRQLGLVEIGAGSDVAFAVGLTGDPTVDAERYLREFELPIARLIVLDRRATPLLDQCRRTAGLWVGRGRPESWYALRFRSLRLAMSTSSCCVLQGWR